MPAALHTSPLKVLNDPKSPVELVNTRLEAYVLETHRGRTAEKARSIHTQTRASLLALQWLLISGRHDLSDLDNALPRFLRVVTFSAVAE